jgi:hypothetical protein
MCIDELNRASAGQPPSGFKPFLDDIGPKVTHVGDNGLALSIKIATQPKPGGADARVQ